MCAVTVCDVLVCFRCCMRGDGFMVTSCPREVCGYNGSAYQVYDFRKVTPYNLANEYQLFGVTWCLRRHV